MAEASYAGELADWGVPPQTELFRGNYHSHTPAPVPGATTITTPDLQKRIAAGSDLILVDVLGGGVHPTIPSAHWLPGSGTGDNFADATQARFAEKLKQLTGGN